MGINDNVNDIDEILGQGERESGPLAVVRHPVKVLTTFRTPRDSLLIWGIDI